MVGKFPHILLPVDFSAHCDEAAVHAAWFAQVGGGKLHLVHVIGNPLDALYGAQDVANYAVFDHATERARALLEEAAKRCLPPACEYELQVVHGDPFDRLMATIEELQPDLIVMSTHGRGGIKHLVIGSVAEKIVRHAPCPAFIVRRKQD